MLSREGDNGRTIWYRKGEFAGWGMAAIGRAPSRKADTEERTRRELDGTERAWLRREQIVSTVVASARESETRHPATSVKTSFMEFR
jgi:hypothetical protein